MSIIVTSLSISDTPVGFEGEDLVLLRQSRYDLSSEKNNQDIIQEMTQLLG